MSQEDQSSFCDIAWRGDAILQCTKGALRAIRHAIDRAPQGSAGKRPQRPRIQGFAVMLHVFNSRDRIQIAWNYQVPNLPAARGEQRGFLAALRTLGL